MAVVEAEREPHKVRVKALPHVHLDGERLPPRDQPPAGHEHGAHEAERDDCADEEPELVLIVRRERAVDHVLRDPDEGDLRALRADREHDRDDQRDRVGAQEAEQPDGSLAIAGRLLHPRNLAIAALAQPRAAAETVRVEVPETRYAQSGDIAIAYKTVGEGPFDLVWTPGAFSNLDLMWEEPALARFYDGLAPFSRLLLFRN